MNRNPFMTSVSKKTLTDLQAAQDHYKELLSAIGVDNMAEAISWIMGHKAHYTDPMQGRRKDTGDL